MHFYDYMKLSLSDFSNEIGDYWWALYCIKVFPVRDVAGLVFSLLPRIFKQVKFR